VPDACFGQAGDHTSDTATASRTLSPCSVSTDIRRVTPRRDRRTTSETLRPRATGIPSVATMAD